MKKKALLLMPFFMGYENDLMYALEEYYDVDMVNNEKYCTCINSFLSSSRIKRIIRRKCKRYDFAQKEKVMNLYGNKLSEDVNSNENAYDLIFCINGHYISNDFWDYLKAKNKDALMVVYLWDDIDNLFQTGFVDKFDLRYSFNLNDCNKFNMKYLPMFVQGSKLEHEKNNKYDLAIIGTAHADRVDFVKKIYEKYKTEYTFYIHLYHPTNQSGFFCYNYALDYSKYIEILSQSKVVFDIPSIKQNGPTTRFFDALLTETKVISTNKNIVNYPIYSKNIDFIDREDPIINRDFVNDTYIVNDYKPLSAKNWINTLLN